MLKSIRIYWPVVFVLMLPLVWAGLNLKQEEPVMLVACCTYLFIPLSLLASLAAIFGVQLYAAGKKAQAKFCGGLTALFGNMILFIMVMPDVIRKDSFVSLFLMGLIVLCLTIPVLFSGFRLLSAVNDNAGNQIAEIWVKE